MRSNEKIQRFEVPLHSFSLIYSGINSLSVSGCFSIHEESSPTRRRLVYFTAMCVVGGRENIASSTRGVTTTSSLVIIKRESGFEYCYSISTSSFRLIKSDRSSLWYTPPRMVVNKTGKDFASVFIHPHMLQTHDLTFLAIEVMLKRIDSVTSQEAPDCCSEPWPWVPAFFSLSSLNKFIKHSVGPTR